MTDFADTGESRGGRARRSLDSLLGWKFCECRWEGDVLIVTWRGSPPDVQRWKRIAGTKDMERIDG